MCVETLTGVLFWSSDLLGKPFRAAYFPFETLSGSLLLLPIPRWPAWTPSPRSTTTDTQGGSCGGCSTWGRSTWTRTSFRRSTSCRCRRTKGCFSWSSTKDPSSRLESCRRKPVSRKPSASDSSYVYINFNLEPMFYNFAFSNRFLVSRKSIPKKYCNILQQQLQTISQSLKYCI